MMASVISSASFDRTAWESRTLSARSANRAESKTVIRVQMDVTPRVNVTKKRIAQKIEPR